MFRSMRAASFSRTVHCQYMLDTFIVNMNENELNLSELKDEVKTYKYTRCHPPNLALSSPCISPPNSTPMAVDFQVSASTSVFSDDNLSIPSCHNE